MITLVVVSVRPGGGVLLGSLSLVFIPDVFRDLVRARALAALRRRLGGHGARVAVVRQLARPS